jgi:hypothetical protein
MLLEEVKSPKIEGFLSPSSFSIGTGSDTPEGYPKDVLVIMDSPTLPIPLAVQITKKERALELRQALDEAINQVWPSN